MIGNFLHMKYIIQNKTLFFERLRAVMKTHVSFGFIEICTQKNKFLNFPIGRQLSLQLISLPYQCISGLN